MKAYLKAATLAVLAMMAMPAFAEEAQETKPIASITALPRSFVEFNLLASAKTENVVIRSAEELVAQSSTPQKAKDVDAQKETTAQLVRLLRVETIDWDKQMVLGISRDDISCAGRMEIQTVSTTGDIMTVNLVVDRRARRCPGRGYSLALVNRFEGEVKFVDVLSPLAVTVAGRTELSIKDQPNPLGPVQSWRGDLVIQSAEELVAHSSTPEKAKDTEAQKAITQQLAQVLDTEINWDKQMVVGTYRTVGSCSGTGASTLDVNSFKIEGTTLTVRLAIHNGGPRRAGQPFWALALVNRHDGEVKFVSFDPQPEKK